VGKEANFIDNNAYLAELKKFTTKASNVYVYLSTDDIGLINEIEKTNQAPEIRVVNIDEENIT
jgi:hypothetical protein